MKILQVNNVYAEKSTGKLTMQLHEGLLKRGIEAVAVYGRGRTFRGEGVIRLCPDWYGKFQSLLSRVTGMPYGGCLLSTWRLMGIIRREKPDVVHLQCINGHFVNIYRLIRWLKKNRIKTVVSLHAEFMYTANCGHAYECMQWQTGCKHCPNGKTANKSWLFDRTKWSFRAMQKAFAGFEEDCVVTPVSPWTQMRGQQSLILGKFPFETVLNGVDTGIFHRDDTLPEPATALCVTAHFSPDPNHHKGGWYLIQLAKRMPDVNFLVAGKQDSTGDIPGNLHLLGEIRDQKVLAALYRRAKVSLLVGKRETFSMPCAESLCCGTPVVGFRAGAPEQIALEAFSDFAPHGDLDTLETLLRQWLRREVDRAALGKAAETAYSTDTMVTHFMEVYRRSLWN